MMRPMTPLPALHVVFALLALGPGSRAEEAGERFLRPDAQVMLPPYQVRGGAVELAMNGVRLRVEPLDERRRETWLELRGGLGFDPLPKIERYPKGFTVFEIALENLSGQQATFTPNLVTCRLDKDLEVRLIQEDQLLDLLRAGHGEGLDAAQAAFDGLSAFHVAPLILEHGQRAARLMVFEGPPLKARQLSLELDHLFIGQS